MQNKSISLPISFSVNNEISDKNNRFIDVTIDVLHTGLNYNGSIFNKEVVDKNIETIKNTPILGFITEVPYDDKDFKGHEYIITKTDKDGNDIDLYEFLQLYENYQNITLHALAKHFHFNDAYLSNRIHKEFDKPFTKNYIKLEYIDCATDRGE